MQAAILAIGTELTDGQIVNRNASWISKMLKALGLTTRIHIVVPDERPLMRDGLNACALNADLIFVTGGLGPTSDDFTREIVSEWLGKSLQFDETSWQHVNERLTSRGYTVKEIQRQQCYFPEGAKILTNSQGTANGFYCQTPEKHIFVLPGPPREIEAIWQDEIHSWLTANTQDLDPLITRVWDTMGVGESDVAVAVAESLQNEPADLGYRVHLPYVEVKLSYRKSQELQMTATVAKLTEALSYCTITRDGDDVATLFSRELKKFESLSLVDEVSGQFLMNRLMPVLRNFMTTSNWSFSKTRKETSASDLQLELLPIDEQSCEALLRIKGQVFTEVLTSPYKTENMKERRLQYFSELALIFWLRCLRK